MEPPGGRGAEQVRELRLLRDGHGVLGEPDLPVQPILPFHPSDDRKLPDTGWRRSHQSCAFATAIRARHPWTLGWTPSTTSTAEPVSTA